MRSTGEKEPNIEDEMSKIERRIRCKDSYSLTKTNWQELFNQIKEQNNITRVAKLNNIRIQTLTKKYQVYKRTGLIEDFYNRKGKWNRYFSDIEEHYIVQTVADLYIHRVINEPTSPNTIKTVSIRLYKKINCDEGKKNIKDFKASKGWIAQFSERHPELENLKKGLYFAWTIIQKKVH